MPIAVEGLTLAGVIHRGNLSFTCRAQDESLGRNVAVQFLDLGTIRDSSLACEIKDQFFADLKQIADVTHEAVPQVHAAHPDSKLPYAVLEYFDGVPLKQLNERLTAWPAGVVVHVGLQVCRALKHCHQQNQIQHRCLRPDSILLNTSGQLKIMDWGMVGTDLDVNQATVTSETTPVAASLYLSPEAQSNAQRVDHRSDLYALGLIMLEMLCGEFPLPHETEMQLLRAKLNGVDAASLEAPAELTELIAAMLAGDPEERPADYQSIISVLEQMVPSDEEVRDYFTRLPDEAFAIQEEPFPDGDGKSAKNNSTWTSDLLAPLENAREVEAKVVPGRRIGDYMVVRPIGMGGMGVVYWCQHVETGDHVAMKFLICDPANMEKRVKQVQQEAEIISHLRHPSIVDVREIGSAEGLTFMVMDLFLGPYDLPVNLMDYSKRFGPGTGLVEQDDLKEIMLVLLDAVGYAHDHGVVHCDLKPENILFQCTETKRDFWYANLKLTDFGVAKIIGEDFLLTSVTKSLQHIAADFDATADIEALVGTYEYMSPEQRRGEPAVPQSDLFAIGMMVLRLLTGNSQLKLGIRPSAMRKGLSSDWDKLILRALEEDISKRYQSTVEMVEDLSAVQL